jgi:hypothetical protein
VSYVEMQLDSLSDHSRSNSLRYRGALPRMFKLCCLCSKMKYMHSLTAPLKTICYHITAYYCGSCLRKKRSKCIRRSALLSRAPRYLPWYTGTPELNLRPSSELFRQPGMDTEQYMMCHLVGVIPCALVLGAILVFVRIVPFFLRRLPRSCRRTLAATATGALLRRLIFFWPHGRVTLERKRRVGRAHKRCKVTVPMFE